LIVRVSQKLVRQVLLSAPGQRFLKRVRRSSLLAEDIVPYDVHRFDRRSWVLKETEFGVRIWCSLDDRAISRPILLNAYELAETRFIAATVRPADLVVDAGANIGYHALHLARLTGGEGYVEAFEPLPYLADALSASIAENGFESIASVQRIALDERPGTLHLRHAPRTDNFGGAYLAPDGEVPVAQANETITAVRLDDVLGDRPCRFLKMDVEGAEPRVIRGAQATLATGRPVILSELHNRQMRVVSGTNADDFIAQMSALDYSCSRLNPDGTRGEALSRYADQAPLNVVFDPKTR
jgi:FkbM family methyltransferase